MRERDRYIDTMKRARNATPLAAPLRPAPTRPARCHALGLHDRLVFFPAAPRLGASHQVDSGLGTSFETIRTFTMPRVALPFVRRVISTTAEQR